jgi:hypothetical protein
MYKYKVFISLVCNIFLPGVLEQRRVYKGTKRYVLHCYVKQLYTKIIIVWIVDISASVPKFNWGSWLYFLCA